MEMKEGPLVGGPPSLTFPDVIGGSKGKKGTMSIPQSDPEDYTFWFVGQEPREGKAAKGGKVRSDISKS